MMTHEDTLAYFSGQAAHVQAWRRDLHCIPELGFQEIKTAAYIQARLQEMRVDYKDGIGGTGIVAWVGRERGKTIALRADMDGLPIQEENEFPHRSQHEGQMHACGHDSHVAILLGVIGYLKSIEPELPGKVLFIFQPAEERGDEDGRTGARHMLASGYLDDVDAMFGLHIMSSLEAGKFGLMAGGVMASGDLFRATIHGSGGHDAWVHETTDPIYMAAQVLNAIYALRGRRIDPMKSGTISVGTIEAGTTANVIPESVHLTGTIRTFSAEVRDIFIQGLKDALRIAEVLGGSYDLELPFHVPEVQNDPVWVEKLQRTCEELFGAEAMQAFTPLMGVEDFSWYSHQIPSVFVMLGGRLPGDLRPHHNPRFDIDDSILYRGSALLAQAARDGLVE